MNILARGRFRSLKVFNYRIWAVGALVSNVGTWVQRAAQDWLVLTQLTHHDASAVGTVMALQFGPQLLLLPFTGFAADRFNQRRFLLATQALMGGLAVALGALTVAGLVQLWHVYVFALVFGCVSAFDAPVRQTFVTELVSSGDLANAIALNSMSFNAGRMIGPAVAGLIIASVGNGWAFLLNGISFFAVLGSLLLLRVRDLNLSARAHHARGSLLNGLRYVWHRPDLTAILVMLFLIGTFGLNSALFISTMAASVFHTDARGFGVLSSCLAVGTVVGSLIAAGHATPKFEHLWTGAAIFGVGWLLAAVSPTYWSFGAALIVTGIATLTFMNATTSLLQLTTEPEFRGRVMALRLAIAFGGTPIGAPFVGWVANHFGPRLSLGVGAASGFAAAIVATYTLKRQLHRQHLVTGLEGNDAR